jgi:hypothetical protein
MQTAPSDTLGQEYFRVGSNNTPKAFEDHQLQEINGITYGATARVETYDAVNNVMVTTISCNVTNTTAADITVYEMGLYVYLLNPNGAFLTDRYVPAVPIVIPAGQTVPLYFNIGEVWN